MNDEQSGDTFAVLQHNLEELKNYLDVSSLPECEKVFFSGFVNMRLDIMSLAEKYIDINSLNRDQLISHTQFAYTSGATDLVPYCIEKLGMRQRKGESSFLRMVVLHRKYDIVRLLLDYGEDPNYRYMSDFTPFYQSIACDDVRMFDLLFMYGGDVNQYYDGETYAVRAFTMGHRCVAARLFELGIVELHRIAPSLEPKFIYTLLCVNNHVRRNDASKKTEDRFLVQYTTIHSSKELRERLLEMYGRANPFLVGEYPLTKETLQHLSTN